MPPLRPVTTEEVETFRRDGVVCLRGVLRPELVAALAGPVEEAIHGSESADLSAMGDALSGAGGSGRGRGRFRAGTDHWRTRPALRAFACTSPLPALVAAVLRSATVTLWEDSILVKEPGTAEATAWHQDLSYFHVDGDQVCTSWCPLDPVTVETGAMRFVRGSHRWDAVFRPNLFVTDTPIPGTEGDPVPDIDAGDYDVVTFDLAPGDITVHHARTLHAAGPNRSATVRRRAISVRYCGDDVRFRARPGAPRKAEHAGLNDGDPLGPPACPRVWPPDQDAPGG